MEPILDETSLVPCPSQHPSTRLQRLAGTLTALDSVGARRVLRSVRDAVDRDIGDGRGLRTWCFDRAVLREAGRLVALRLTNQPYVDELHAELEETRAIEARLADVVAFGAGLAALRGDPLVVLASAARSVGSQASVTLEIVDDAGTSTETVFVRQFTAAAEVTALQASLTKQVLAELTSGLVLLARFNEVFPSLRLGTLARDQLSPLSGNHPLFSSLLRHLSALQSAAASWPVEPTVAYSEESSATLAHPMHGPLRDFPVPDGYSTERWSLHTKLAKGHRLYFRPVRDTQSIAVLIGYFGVHLSTVRFG